jgi:tRNA-dihydrouridine synthase C
MEGVIDHTMRSLLTSIGGIDRCTTEFLRITDHQLPRRVFIKICPELTQQGKTPNGTPVHLQLLGNNPEAMALNARKGALLGAPGIDINFGCPAKTVNNHGGGATLLKDPEQLFAITQAIREAVPAHIPVSAKIRLGYNDTSLALENAKAIEEAGANELTVHGRTKLQGYKPPADWQMIDAIKNTIAIPVIANGEIWTPEDYQLCREQSQCEDIMIGRGLLAQPSLANEIQHQAEALPWKAVTQLIITFLDSLSETCPERFRANLIKQWLVYLQRSYPEAVTFFQQIKRVKDSNSLYLALGTVNPEQRQPERQES